jgi:hypothetical protein
VWHRCHTFSPHAYGTLAPAQSLQSNPIWAVPCVHPSHKRRSVLDSGDYKLLCRIRNNSSFHYDPTLTVRYLEKLVEEYPDHRFPYSLGQDTLDWYFELGDLINDKIVVRDIFKVPAQADVRTAIDPILLRLNTMAVAFTDFAGHFIRHCVKR